MKRNTLSIGSMAAGVVLLLAVSACSKSSTSDNKETGGTSFDLITSLPAATKSVDSVTWNLPYEPASLDPIKTQVYADSPVESNMCENLLKVKPDLSVEPNLASTVTPNADATVWKYELRDDVKFWDGSPMTADDVVASLKRNLDPDAGSYWSLEYKHVKSITASGDHEVTITLSQPDALLNNALSTSAGAVSKASALAASGAKYGDPTVGVTCTGPFTFGSWKPGDSITLEANDSYWNQSAKPVVSKLVYKFVSDPNTISSGLLDGSLDGMYQVPAATIPELEKSSTGKLYQGPSTASLDLFPTERPGPLQNADVRKALFFALDRGAVASTVYHGAATPAKSFVNPGVGYGKDIYQAYFDSLPGASVDLDKAKSLIAKAGDAANGPIRLATSPDPSLITVANAIVSAGKELGMNITVETLTAAENDALYFDPKVRGKYDAFLNVQWTLATDPLEELDFVTKGAFTNYGLYDNPAFEDAFNSAIGVVEPDARARATVEALKLADADLPWIPIVSLPVTTYVSSKLTGIPTSWAFMYGQWAQGLGGK